VKLLVLTPEPVTAKQLRDAVEDGVDSSEVEVMVVAPALHEDAFHFWLSDADDAIAKADQVSRRTVKELDEAGVAASGDTGESDPAEAIKDTLTTFPADRIVVFTHRGSERRYREDVDLDALEQRFGLPVDHAVV
jgi:hypothetical protein